LETLRALRARGGRSLVFMYSRSGQLLFDTSRTLAQISRLSRQRPCRQAGL